MGAFVLFLIIIIPQVIKEMAESKKEAISLIIVFLVGTLYSIMLSIVLITGNDFLTNPEGNIIDQHSLQFTTFVVMIELIIAIKEFYDKYFASKMTYSNIRLDTSYYNRLSTHEIIVLNSLKQCSSKDHKLEDVEAIIMTVLPNGLISPETINISYCRNCDQYIATILEYNELKGIPLCKVIDKTKEENQSNKHTTYDSSNYDKTGSKLTQYGYNVNVSDNLTKEQRQTILGVQIYNGMTKAEIICYIDSNIHNGELRKDSAKSWDNAISKWKEDKEFVQNFDNEKFIKKIDVDKIILKYTRHKNPK